MPVTTRSHSSLISKNTMPVSRRRLRRKKPDVTTDILLHHILPRLPAKSVFRLMAVCKEFHSFIKTLQFAKMHLRHVINDHRYKFLVLSREQGRWLFSSIDCETTTTTAGCLIPPPNRPVPFLAPNTPNLPVPFLEPNMRVLTSFHGLVCVGIFSASGLEYTNLILWNPATSDYKILPKTNFVIESFRCVFGLYYTSCDDDYKLLHVNSRFEVYNYSLRFDSWRKLVVDLEISKLMICWPTSSVWLNGNLYFLSGLFNLIIMRLDTITEKITVMKTPDFPVKDLCKSLFVHKGYIHICVRFEGIRGNVKYDTWRMNGDEGDWSMVDTYNMDKQVPLACRLTRRSHLMRNGEWLMINCPYKNHILYMFDPEKKAYTYTRLGTTMFFPEEGRYTETLVSPNQYILA